MLQWAVFEHRQIWFRALDLNGIAYHPSGRASHPQREVDITAVVTVTDDGGSSGRLHREFDVLPPRDIRNCMVALSEDEALLSKLFQYRFTDGRGIRPVLGSDHAPA